MISGVILKDNSVALQLNAYVTEKYIDYFEQMLITTSQDILNYLRGT
jgi:hypothetical protein